MTIVSIDFSILFPGICICKDFKEFKWIALVNTRVRKKDKKNINVILSKYPNLKIIETVSRRKKEAEYHLTERTKLINYLELINTLILELKNEVGLDKNIICCLEGISFGSKGNSLVDISQATGMLKQKVIEEILDGDVTRFFVFSPSALKNAIGCKGNANKLDIYNKFIKDPILKSVKKSDLYKLLITEKWIVEKNRVLSPVVDMIDSYLGILKIYELSK
jgi:hypothetical protein